MLKLAQQTYREHESSRVIFLSLWLNDSCGRVASSKPALQQDGRTFELRSIMTHLGSFVVLSSVCMFSAVHVMHMAGLPLPELR